MSGNFRRSDATLQRYTDPPKPANSGGGKGTPDARRFSSTAPMRRSGTMSRSVVIRRKADSYFVQIHPTKVYPDGKRVVLIAEYLEKGSRHVVKLTRARLAYLHATSKKRGNKKVKSGLKLGSTVVISKAPRPVWEPTFRKLPSWRKVYQKALRNWLRIHGKTGRTPRR